METSWREQVSVNPEINDDGLFLEVETESRKQTMTSSSLLDVTIPWQKLLILFLREASCILPNTINSLFYSKSNGLFAFCLYQVSEIWCSGKKKSYDII